MTRALLDSRWAAPRRTCLGAVVLATVVSFPGPVAAQEVTDRCIAGVIAKIEIDNQPIYPIDDSDPGVVQWAFKTANLLHIETAPSFIRRELLFEEGDCYDPFVLTESRRLLDDYPFIGDVFIETVDEGAPEKTVRVTTRDEWSTQIDIRPSYDDGLNFERFQITEENLLGQGVRAEFTHAEYREQRDRGVRVFTPRFFGRTDADIRFGNTRGGAYFSQLFQRTFLGETNRFSVSESFDRKTSFYSYATGSETGLTHLLVPVFEEVGEVAAAIRLGEPGASWIVGLGLERSEYRQDGEVESVMDEDFGNSTPGATPPADVVRQVTSRGATRLGLHVGTRRVRYEDYFGLDAVSARELVELGFFGGVSVGRSLGVFTPSGVPDADDTFVRSHARWTVPLGKSLVHVRGSAESGYADGRWRDVLAQADLVAYGRTDALPNQTFFLRASMGGGWRTSIPFQLSLGGRDGVRSLRADAFPGGRRAYFVFEDRIRFDWPPARALELGATLFADAGRTWAADSPFGTDSDWVGSVGFGLRVAVPTGSRTIWRPEIAFPVGHDGSPVFRMTFELQRIRLGFGTPRWLTSRRFARGAESY